MITPSILIVCHPWVRAVCYLGQSEYLVPQVSQGWSKWVRGGVIIVHSFRVLLYWVLEGRSFVGAWFLHPLPARRIFGSGHYDSMIRQ